MNNQQDSNNQLLQSYMQQQTQNKEKNRCLNVDEKNLKKNENISKEEQQNVIQKEIENQLEVNSETTDQANSQPPMSPHISSPQLTKDDKTSQVII